MGDQAAFDAVRAVQIGEMFDLIAEAVGKIHCKAFKAMILIIKTFTFAGPMEVVDDNMPIGSIDPGIPVGRRRKSTT